MKDLYTTWLGTVDMFQTFQTGISDETYEQLRQILKKQNGNDYTLDEAKEIGDGLIDFFATLLELYKEGVADEHE